MKIRAGIFVGPQGSGKNTICNHLQEFVHLEMKKIISDHCEKDPVFRAYVSDVIGSGGLVDCGKVTGLLFEELNGIPPHFPVAFNGVPRTYLQATRLDHFLAKREVSKEEQVVFSLDITDEEVKRRCRERFEETGREDDGDPKVVLRRLATFREEVGPILDFYRAHGIRVVEVDTSGAKEVALSKIKNELYST